jgi:hypothetical protein
VIFCAHRPQTNRQLSAKRGSDVEASTQLLINPLAGRVNKHIFRRAMFVKRLAIYFHAMESLLCTIEIHTRDVIEDAPPLVET